MFLPQREKTEIVTDIGSRPGFGIGTVDIVKYAIENAFITKKQANFAPESLMLFNAGIPAIEHKADRYSRDVIFNAGGLNHLSVTRNVALNGETASKNTVLRGKYFEAVIVIIIRYKLSVLGWEIDVQVVGTNDNLRGTTDIVVTNPNGVAFLLHCKTSTGVAWKEDILTNKGYPSYMVTLGETKYDLSKRKVEDMRKNGIKPVIVSTKNYKSGNGIITLDEMIEEMGGGETAPKSAFA